MFQLIGSLPPLHWRGLDGPILRRKVANAVSMIHQGSLTSTPRTVLDNSGIAACDNCVNPGYWMMTAFSGNCKGKTGPQPPFPGAQGGVLAENGWATFYCGPEFDFSPLISSSPTQMDLYSSQTAEITLTGPSGSFTSASGPPLVAYMDVDGTMQFQMTASSVGSGGVSAQGTLTVAPGIPIGAYSAVSYNQDGSGNLFLVGSSQFQVMNTFIFQGYIPAPDQGDPGFMNLRGYGMSTANGGPKIQIWSADGQTLYSTIQPDAGCGSDGWSCYVSAVQAVPYDGDVVVLILNTNSDGSLTPIGQVSYTVQG